MVKKVFFCKTIHIDSRPWIIEKLILKFSNWKSLRYIYDSTNIRSIGYRIMKWEIIDIYFQKMSVLKKMKKNVLEHEWARKEAMLVKAMPKKAIALKVFHRQFQTSRDVQFEKWQYDSASYKMWRQNKRF